MTKLANIKAKAIQHRNIVKNATVTTTYSLAVGGSIAVSPDFGGIMMGFMFLGPIAGYGAIALCAYLLYGGAHVNATDSL